jgi:hypothetical protein
MWDTFIYTGVVCMDVMQESQTRPIDGMEFKSMTVMGAKVSISVWPDGLGPVHIDTPSPYAPEYAAEEVAAGILPTTDECREVTDE